MAEPRRVEVNPGEWFMIDPRAMHVKEYEAVFAQTSKIGTDQNNQLAYMMSFTGRINNTDREETFTVIMSPQDGWNFISMAIDQYEWLQNQIKKAKED